jgi:hypothetical protein
MQTSGSIRKTNEKKLVPFFYFMFRYIEDALSLHNLMATVLLRYTNSDYPFGIFKLFLLLKAMHYIGEIMVSVLASSA